MSDINLQGTCQPYSNANESVVRIAREGSEDGMDDYCFVVNIQLRDILRKYAFYLLVHNVDGIGKLPLSD